MSVTVETIIGFLQDNGGSVSYSDLKRRFANFLNDPASRDGNKKKFKELLKKVATFTSQKEGSGVITLKEKYRHAASNLPHAASKDNDSTTSVVIAVPKLASSFVDSGFSQSESQPARPPSSTSLSSDASSGPHKQWLVAISNGDLEMVQTLLGDKPDLLDDADSSLGYNAFHWAAATGNCDVIEFLSSKIQSHEAVNRVNRAGHTPLHVAYMHNRLAAAQILERRGADIFAEDFSCRQPVYYSRTASALLMRPDSSPATSKRRQKMSTLERMGEIASKIREKVRSISSSSSIESLPSSVCSTNSHRGKPGSFFDGFNSDKNNRYLDTDSAVRGDPRFVRGLSASSGAINYLQFTPHLAYAHDAHKSKSTDFSPPLQEPRRSSAELMPPPAPQAIKFDWQSN